MQLSYAQLPRRRVNVIDLKEVFQFVAPRVRDAAVKTAGQLNHLGIRYGLAGGSRLALMDTFEPHPM